MELDKEILINAIRGTSGPYYNLLTKYENLGLGKYVGGFHDKFVWNNISSFEQFTEEQLKEFYVEIKDSWK
jgi:hypothetical protein